MPDKDRYLVICPMEHRPARIYTTVWMPEAHRAVPIVTCPLCLESATRK